MLWLNAMSVDEKRFIDCWIKIITVPCKIICYKIMVSFHARILSFTHVPSKKLYIFPNRLIYQLKTYMCHARIRKSGILGFGWLVTLPVSIQQLIMSLLLSICCPNIHIPEQGQYYACRNFVSISLLKKSWYSLIGLPIQLLPVRLARISSMRKLLIPQFN